MPKKRKKRVAKKKVVVPVGELPIKETTLVKVVECARCFDGLYGRCDADRRRCTCEALRIEGGPSDPTVRTGFVRRTYEKRVAGTLADMHDDWVNHRTFSYKFRHIRFHYNVMSWLTTSLFPIAWRQTVYDNPSDMIAGHALYQGSIGLVPPRNLFPNARVVRAHDRPNDPRMVWAENNSIVGRLQYKIVSTHRKPGQPSSASTRIVSSRRVVLMDFERANTLRGARRRIQELHWGYCAAMAGITQDVPEWWKLDLPVYDLFQLDVLDVQRYTKRAGFRAGLVAKKRLGNLFVNAHAAQSK